MLTHVLYIDDSGTKEYAKSHQIYGVGVTRYFVFGGFLISIEASGRLADRIISLKQEHFGTPDVEIKSNWLRIPAECKARYLDKYSLTDSDLKEFVDAYYDAILESQSVFLGAVVDKKHTEEDYSWGPYYPPAIAYEIILQRLENELRYANHKASVVIDDMTGATPHGNQYKRNLKRQHEDLKKRGSKLIPGFNFTCIEGPARFKNSQNSHLIQVADIAAYNVYRQFVDHGEDWENQGLTHLPTYDYLYRILKKFRQGAHGRVQGYGVIKFPLRKRVEWTVE